jgi:hypothetical protein
MKSFPGQAAEMKLAALEAVAVLFRPFSSTYYDSDPRFPCTFSSNDIGQNAIRFGADILRRSFL